MNRFIADENFPIPSYRVLLEHNIDVVHVGLEEPSIDDKSVLKLAITQDRILLTSTEITVKSYLPATLQFRAVLYIFDCDTIYAMNQVRFC